MGWLRKRFSEPSSWAGVGLLVTQAANAYATKDPAAIAAVLGGLLAIVAPEAQKAA